MSEQSLNSGHHLFSADAALTLSSLMCLANGHRVPVEFSQVLGWTNGLAHFKQQAVFREVHQSLPGYQVLLFVTIWGWGWWSNIQMGLLCENVFSFMCDAH